MKCEGDCRTGEAITKRPPWLCKKCLTKRLNADYPKVIKDLSTRGTEDVGRSHRSAATIGGDPYHDDYHEE